MYKGYSDLGAAEEAFRQKPEKIIYGKSKNINNGNTNQDNTTSSPIHDSIVVDAAWNSVNKDMEYQGIFYKSGNRIFHNGPLPNGTNNIGEFLAIVHALGYCQKHGHKNTPIYSDSRNAITWVNAKKCKTNLELWLKKNIYQNQILKWETKAWGENPADFGRK
jgi:ribonuclease HI